MMFSNCLHQFQCCRCIPCIIVQHPIIHKASEMKANADSCIRKHHLKRDSNPFANLISFASLPANADTFNSLSKVLFILPSWYLFAIGLNFVFSFRWQLPPTLHSSSEECDSTNANCKWRESNVTWDNHPLWCFLPKGTHLLLHELCFCRLQLRTKILIFTRSLSQFIRHYFGNVIWCLFLRLLICLNSAGNHAWGHVIMLY